MQIAGTFIIQRIRISRSGPLEIQILRPEPNTIYLLDTGMGMATLLRLNSFYACCGT